MNGELSKEFEISSGVRQGCVLSPLLFGVLIDYVLRTSVDVINGGLKLGNKTIKDVDFADDLAIIDDKTESFRAMFNKLIELARTVGLHINYDKTKIMLIKPSGEPCNFNFEGHNIENVDQFKYLGSTVVCNGGQETEVRIRIGQASAAFAKLTKVFTDKQISLKTKLRLLDSMVISVLRYGLETIALRQVDMAKLEAFHNRCLRRLLGVRWQDYVSNIEIRRRTGREPFSNTLHRARLQWLGHVLRMPEDRLPNIALHNGPTGKRGRGRPPKRWMDVVKQDLEGVGLPKSLVAAYEACQDRTRWCSLVSRSEFDPQSSVRRSTRR